MPRVSRLFLAATLSTLAALLPVTAFAAGSLTAYVVGAEYAFGHPCIGGTSTGTTVGTTASFAGYGSASAGGRANAVFKTTICHKDAQILAGGSFLLATRQRTLVGQYSDGSLTPIGLPTPLGSTLCTQSFLVEAHLKGLTAGIPTGAKSITSGSAGGTLTHIGVFTGPVCTAFAATITGWAMLHY